MNLTFEQFKVLQEKNPRLKKDTAIVVASRLGVSEDLIKEYRKRLKEEKKVNLDNVPSEFELEQVNYQLDPRVPIPPRGFSVSSFQLNKDNQIQSQWFKAEESSSLTGINTFDWNGLKNTLLKSVKSIKTNKNINGKILSLYFGDSHVGIQIDKNSPITSTVLDFKTSLLKTLDLINEPFKEVVVVFGGDMTDSVLNESSRKGHYLPSTMNDRQMFETFIEGSQVFFASLVENPLVGKVSFYSVSEDNHTGYMAGIQSRALELWLNAKYPDVETNVFDENIGWYTKDNHIYIVMHGKDSRQQFKNAPLILDAKTESYLMAWCLSKGITPNYKNTHVIKFDLHQSSYQLGKFFSYLNCLSMQAGSTWQQLNFMASSPGVTYSIQSDNGIQNGELFL